MSGFCQCGCGSPTKIAGRNYRQLGLSKGEPFHYRRGHNPSTTNVAVNGRLPRHDGYTLVVDTDHPNAQVGGRILEHVLVVSTVLGKPIPPGVVIHHVDHDRSNNRNNNLVVCQDHAYHMLLHLRERALLACGNANYRKCRFCQRWDDPEQLMRFTTGNYYHSDCRSVHRLAAKMKRAAYV